MNHYLNYNSLGSFPLVQALFNCPDWNQTLNILDRAHRNGKKFVQNTHVKQVIRMFTFGVSYSN